MHLKGLRVSGAPQKTLRGASPKIFPPVPPDPLGVPWKPQISKNCIFIACAQNTILESQASSKQIKTVFLILALSYRIGTGARWVFVVYLRLLVQRLHFSIICLISSALCS